MDQKFGEARRLVRVGHKEHVKPEQVAMLAEAGEEDELIHQVL